jgi:hypothetical protein
MLNLGDVRQRVRWGGSCRDVAEARSCLAPAAFWDLLER